MLSLILLSALGSDLTVESRAHAALALSSRVAAMETKVVAFESRVAKIEAALAATPQVSQSLGSSTPKTVGSCPNGVCTACNAAQCTPANCANGQCSAMQPVPVQYVEQPATTTMQYSQPVYQQQYVPMYQGGCSGGQCGQSSFQSGGGFRVFRRGGCASCGS